jgi:hypothetical protein
MDEGNGTEYFAQKVTALSKTYLSAEGPREVHGSRENTKAKMYGVNKAQSSTFLCILSYISNLFKIVFFDCTCTSVGKKCQYITTVEKPPTWFIRCIIR